jgi:hypothetical protein
MSKLIFILSGEVKIYIENNSSTQKIYIVAKKTSNIQFLRSYKPGYIIGAKNFLTGSGLEYSGTTSMFSEIAYLEMKVKSRRYKI